MTLSRLRIISRKSPLAMWQAEHVRTRLQALYPELRVEIIGISTQADRFLERSLASMGGKAVFVKELEQALLAQQADLAVHSMKDVPVELPEGLGLPVILARADPRDAFVCNRCDSLAALPVGARIGTSSLRRRCQLMALRPDLHVLDIRGNLGTRLARLDAGHFDALILAAAGLKRLGQVARIGAYLPINELLPAIGQGALGLEIRSDDTEVLSLLSALDDPPTHSCVAAERALGRAVNGGCHAPLAAYASLQGERLSLSALVGRLDGREIIRVSGAGSISTAVATGRMLGEQLLARGAAQILAGLGDYP